MAKTKNNSKPARKPTSVPPKGPAPTGNPGTRSDGPTIKTEK